MSLADLRHWLEAAAPIVAAIIVAWSATQAFSRQRKLDREAAVNSKRRELYSAYLRDIMLMAGRAPLDVMQRNQQTKAEILLYGSDRVARAVTEFSRVIDVTDPSEIELRDETFAPRALKAYASMLKAMRDDVSELSGLNEKELENLAPWKLPSQKVS